MKLERLQTPLSISPTTRSVKIARSFFSIFVGWCVAIVALISWQVFAPSGSGHVTNFNFFLIWPGLFGFIGWLIFIVPAVIWVSEDNRLMQFPVSMIAGAVYGMVVYLLLVCTWFPSIWLVWFPAIMGGAGGGVYSLLGRSQIFRRLHATTTVCFYAAPVVSLVLFSFIIWPSVTTHLPYFAYVFGASQSRENAHLQILKGIRSGDTYAVLHRRYPRIFSEPFLGQSGGGSHYTYSIAFDETRTYVSEITIHDSRQD